MIIIYAWVSLFFSLLQGKPWSNQYIVSPLYYMISLNVFAISFSLYLLEQRPNSLGHINCYLMLCCTSWRSIIGNLNEGSGEIIDCSLYWQVYFSLKNEKHHLLYQCNNVVSLKKWDVPTVSLNELYVLFTTT